MKREGFTQTPNILFDQLLKILSCSELKILLVIIRQTNGWQDKRTKKRKERDRLTYNQFIEKTGLSRRTVSEAIKLLVEKKLIRLSDLSGNVLNNPEDRKGKYHIFYASNLEHMQSLHISTCAINDTNICNLQHQHVQNMVHNKRNYNKIKYTKERENELKSIKEIIDKKYL